MKVLLAVDPGLNSCGWAVFHHQEPVRAGIIEPRERGGDAFISRCATVVRQLRNQILEEDPPVEVVCEWMQMFGSASSAMAWKTGDLQRPIFLVGMLAGRLWIPADRFHVVTPNEWKGQLPKDEVIRRIRKLLGEPMCDQLHLVKDAWDAVGIGLHHLGRF
jgi:Holliday junction resolvasome RuvABC endonuclease subunit